MADNKIDYPLVHVGLPVFNGENFLRIALGALVAQDYPNFEIIVVDNASTDSTRDIVHEFMNNYNNITLHENETNIGVMNGIKVFELSNAPYFMWAAHDDKFEPTFISKTVAALEQHPEAVLCNGHTRFLDESSNVIVGPNNNEIHTLGMNTIERVTALSARLGWFAFYSMMRTSVLKKIKLAFNAWGTDVIFLEELSLLGPFIMLPEVLFNYRVVHNSVSQSLATLCETKEGKAPTPYSDLARNLLDLINHTDLPESEKKEIREELFKTICFKNKIWNNLFLQENLDYFKESMNNCLAAGSPDINEVDRMFRKLAFETKIENPQFEGFSLTGCNSISTPPYGFNIIHDSDSLEDNVMLRNDIQLLQNLMYPISLTNINDISAGAQLQISYGVNIFYIENHVRFAALSPKYLIKARLNVLVGDRTKSCVQFDKYTEIMSESNCKSFYYDYIQKCSSFNYPTLSEFMSTITVFVEKGNMSEALSFYQQNRDYYPADSSLLQFDELMIKLGKMQQSQHIL
jgi:glycosyltransferase involved in cell wall biosynthesis